MRLPQRLPQTSLSLAAALIGVSFVLAMARSSCAEQYYVNNVEGDDQNNGLARPLDTNIGRNGPFKTIGRALKSANRGDRIIVQKTDQPYRESLTIQGPQHDGSPNRKFHLYSDGAVLDGTRPVGMRWEPLEGDVFRFEPERKSYQQLFQNGLPLPRTTLEGDQTPLDLQAGEWTLHKGFIYFCTDGRQPHEYDLSYCYLPVGITLYQVHDVVIEGFVIQGFHLDGVNAHDRVKESIAVSCILRGNGRSGLSVGGSSHFDVIACLIGDNYTAQLRTEGYSTTTLKRTNLLDANQYGPPISNHGGKIIRGASASE